MLKTNSNSEVFIHLDKKWGSNFDSSNYNTRKNFNTSSLISSNICNNDINPQDSYDVLDKIPIAAQASKIKFLFLCHKNYRRKRKVTQRSSLASARHCLR